jgi:DNA-binding TFAR19-related protein (PDSD5 family)
MSEEEELEQVKRKRLEEHKKASEGKKAEEQLKTTLRMTLDDAAYQRILNVKLAKPQLFLMAAQNVLSIYKQVGRKVTEKELLFILHRIKEQTDKQTEIKFERK